MNSVFPSQKDLRWQGQGPNTCRMESTDNLSDPAPDNRSHSDGDRGTESNRNLPKYVHTKRAKGRLYYYFCTGRRSSDGKLILTPLPAPGKAGFTVQLAKAQRARFQHETRVFAPLQQKRPDFGAFNPDALSDTPTTSDDLYFIRAGDAVKIGRAADVFSRFINMQANNHLELDCICRLPCRGHEERQWQAYFNEHWIRGEWFDWGPEIEAAINLAREGQQWWK